MDCAKIALPRFQVTNKMICGLGQLPITLIKMIVHVVMGMRNMPNTLMSCGLMIPISQLGPYCNIFELCKKNSNF
jgi:hypothetical protein